MYKNLFKYILPALAGLVVGFAVCYMFSYSPGSNKIGAGSECFRKYFLTNRHLDCNEYEESLSTVQALSAKYDAAIKIFVDSGKAERVSVWTRDLDTRLWAASNEFEQYAPASLFKVPVMIAYYKLAEIQPTLLDTQLEYQPKGFYKDQNFDPEEKLIAGQRYRAAELIDHMIIYSDNEAAALLLEHLDSRVYADVLLDLGIRVPSGDGSTDFVTVKTYANIYRILYNSSYLTREYSQRALENLAKSTFKGISEPLPADIAVAHKFGERKLESQSGAALAYELHDCGIVYKKENPYNICIMSEGKNFDDLLSIIKNLSAIAYENM